MAKEASREVCKAQRSRLAQRVASVLIGGAWVVFIGILVAAGAELYLSRQRTSLQSSHGPPGSPLRSLEDAYHPFRQQHLHPIYMFFFPLEDNARRAINNSSCSVDEDGFRGKGPAYAGGRKLAFILGGSAAFGDLASSDETTITGYLNVTQQEFFFVNAGVPSWNSTQELARLTYQIRDHKPDLIVAYDGYNDYSVLSQYLETGHIFPPGAPESFHLLRARVDDIRAELLPAEEEPRLAKLLPSLAKRITARRFRLEEVLAAIEDNAKRYLSNIVAMRDLAEGVGARFLWVYQPARSEHATLPPGVVDRGSMETLIAKRFGEIVRADAPHGVEFLDLSNAFDRIFDPVLALPLDQEPRLRGDHIFFDKCHLTDRGNAIIARLIGEQLNSR